MNVREIAYKTLCDVMIKKDYANLNMRNFDYGLNESDQGLLTQIVYGTLRNYRYVRYQWMLYIDKVDDRKLSVLLDMSAYQILLLDKVPSYACVNEAVEIAKKLNGGRYTTLVNAVLRKLANNGPQKVNGTDEYNKLGIETSHPDWLVRMWVAHYGMETTEKICFENLSEGRIALRVNTLLTSKEELLRDERFSEGYTEGSLYYKGNILATDYFRNNLVIIQSESSQKVVEVVDPKKKDRILDMCAAPGTKSIQMAMKTGDECDIYAVDIYEQRVELINKAVSNYNLKSIKTMCEDGRNLPVKLPLYYFDKVLLDAPCSGLGTLKHKPEIKMNITAGDLDDIVRLQSQLLDSACLMVRNNGYLIYSTCTLNKKENDRQISMFLSQHPEFELVHEDTIFPYDHHSDGFYIAKMHKNMLE